MTTLDPSAPVPAGPAGRFAWSDFSQVKPARAFLLMGLGAVVGLVLAGFALFTARGTSSLIVPADAVAMVNQQPVSRIDFDAQLRALGADPAAADRAMRNQTLNDMIREELFVQRAKELDVAMVDPEVRGAMVKAVESQAAANAITAQPTEEDIGAYYQAHRAKYASEGVMVLRDLVFPADTAAEARAALAAGAGVEPTVARFGGRDTGAVNGEEFYFAARIHLGEALFAAARVLGTGQVSAPLVRPDGVHVLAMTRNDRPRPYSLEEARSQVATDRQAEQIAKYEKANERFLRKRANVLIAKDLR